MFIFTKICTKINNMALKRYLLVISLFSLFFINASAQDFQFRRVSQPVVVGDTDRLYLTLTKAIYINTSATPQSIRIIRVLNQFPDPSWHSNLCVRGLCYSPDADTIPPRGAPTLIINAGQSDTITIEVGGIGLGTAKVILKAFVISNPSFFIVDTFMVQRIPVGIRHISSVVEDYKLNQNFPNPFNPETIIRFSIPKNENVRLTVYDILGKKVVDIYNGFMPAGSYSTDFNASELPSGIYYYILKTDNITLSRKMMLVK